MIVLFLLAAVVVDGPRGLDPSHIPMGSPLGAVPILISPGEPIAILRKPMSEAQWETQQRARIAQAMKQPRARMIAKWLADNERKEAEQNGAPAPQ